MRRWAGRAAVAGTLWLLVGLGAWVLGAQPHPGLLALLVAVVAAVLWLLLDLLETSPPVRWPSAGPAPVREPGEDPRLARLHRLLVQHRTSHEVGDALHHELAALTDQQLLLRHGITRDAAPDRAAALLGADLSRVVAQQPPYPRLSTDHIDLLLRRIEAL